MTFALQDRITVDRERLFLKMLEYSHGNGGIDFRSYIDDILSTKEAQEISNLYEKFGQSAHRTNESFIRFLVAQNVFLSFSLFVFLFTCLFL